MLSDQELLKLCEKIIAFPTKYGDALHFLDAKQVATAFRDRLTASPSPPTDAEIEEIEKRHAEDAANEGDFTSAFEECHNDRATLLRKLRASAAPSVGGESDPGPGPHDFPPRPDWEEQMISAIAAYNRRPRVIAIEALEALKGAGLISAPPSRGTNSANAKVVLKGDISDVLTPEILLRLANGEDIKKDKR